MVVCRAIRDARKDPEALAYIIETAERMTPGTFGRWSLVAALDGARIARKLEQDPEELQAALRGRFACGLRT